MTSPFPKREVVLETVDFRQKTITFWAGTDAATGFATFGILKRDTAGEYYELIVDLRYDFGQVLEHIMSFQNNEYKGATPDEDTERKE